MVEVELVELASLTKQRDMELGVEELEERAIRNPERRDEILSTLNVYTFRYKGESRGREARRAIKKISVITMLEMLHDEPE
jgi:hypothetical protein